MGKRVLAFVLGLTLSGCGGESVKLGSAEPPPEPSARGGWSLRDDVPYPRSGHTAVLDSANDRMLVVGGGANDVWALPLSGPDANVWSGVQVRGEYPPVHSYGSSSYRNGDSAVYDPQGERLMVLLNARPVSSVTSAAVDLWQLSLHGAPEWKRVVTSGRSPGAEVQSGRLAIDVEGRRLFAVGGAAENSGVWSLSLGEEPAPSWTRISDNPLGSEFDYDDLSLIFDASRRRLVLFSGDSGPGLGQIWALSLESASWELLEEGYNAAGSKGAAAVLDPDGDRIVFFGGQQSSGISAFSLSSRKWVNVSVPPPNDAHAGAIGATGVLDAARGRILYFGGRSSNVVQAVGLYSLSWSELVPATRNAPTGMDLRTLVWDPAREAVVAFGDSRGAQTDLHGLSPSDGWTALTDVGWTTPPVSDSAAIYDPVASAIVVLRGDKLARLVWAPGPIWEQVDAGPGPLARSSYAAIYDPVEHRLVVHGGRGVTHLGVTPVYDDVWALSLEGSLRWTPLLAPGTSVLPAGNSPGHRSGHLGIYDPKDHRLIIYAPAQSAPIYGFGKEGVWSLSLDDAPEWTELAVKGRSPGLLDAEAAAVYDPAGHRMVVVTFAETGAARIFALELDTLAWHEFCWPGITPAKTSVDRSTGNAVLVPDGIFMTVSGGAFRFDLETSYCE